MLAVLLLHSLRNILKLVFRLILKVKLFNTFYITNGNQIII